MSYDFLETLFALIRASSMGDEELVSGLEERLRQIVREERNPE